MVRLVRPSRELEEGQAYRWLVACISNHLDRMPDGKRKQETARLWRLLLTLVNDAEDTAERAPSRRGLARLLELPKDRLPPMLDDLGRWARACGKGAAGGTI